MNLIGDPWIPVVMQDGRDKLVGLRELYEQSTDIRDLALPPPQRIAVMRLLLCITHAALDGPSDEDDWRACRERIVPESVRYLDEWSERFDLYGDRPFLQVAGLEPKHNMKVDKLDLRLAAGHAATLFDQKASLDGRLHEPSWIVLQLLTFLSFAASHKIKQNSWAGKATAKNVQYAPCLAGCPVIALVLGGTVLETIHLNLITKEQVPADKWGTPIWDSLPAGPASDEATSHAESYLGHLVPLARAVCLTPGGKDMTVAAAVVHSKPPVYREPMAVVIRQKQGDDWALLRVDLRRHPWRELASVLVIELRDNKQGPFALRHLQHVDVDFFDLWLGGVVHSTSGGYEDMAEWIFTVPCKLLGTSCLARYTSGADLANRGKQVLCDAVKEYCGNLSFKPADFTRKAVLHYWSILDGSHGELITAAGDNSEEALDPWHDRLRSALRDSYASACPHTTPRQIQAFAAGRRKLYLKRTDNQQKEEDKS